MVGVCKGRVEVEGSHWRRYLLEVSQGQQHPPLAGAVLMAAAALTHLAPTLQYFREQHSLLHSLKVVW